MIFYVLSMFTNEASSHEAHKMTFEKKTILLLERLTQVGRNNTLPLYTVFYIFCRMFMRSGIVLVDL